jgi:hypothetical protein
MVGDEARGALVAALGGGKAPGYTRQPPWVRSNMLGGGPGAPGAAPTRFAMSRRRGTAAT